MKQIVVTLPNDFLIYLEDIFLPHELDDVFLSNVFANDEQQAFNRRCASRLLILSDAKQKSVVYVTTASRVTDIISHIKQTFAGSRLSTVTILIRDIPTRSSVHF